MISIYLINIVYNKDSTYLGKTNNFKIIIVLRAFFKIFKLSFMVSHFMIIQKKILKSFYC